MDFVNVILLGRCFFVFIFIGGYILFVDWRWNYAVIDSRKNAEGTSVRRRRKCPECNSRFTTYERIQLRDLIVNKKNNETEPFDRDKIFRSISLALRKRNVDQEKLE